MPSMRSALRDVTSSIDRALSGMSSSRASSVYPTIDVSGVRNSCDTDATRSSRALTAFSSAVMSRKTMTPPS